MLLGTFNYQILTVLNCSKTPHSLRAWCCFADTNWSSAVHARRLQRPKAQEIMSVLVLPLFYALLWSLSLSWWTNVCAFDFRYLRILCWVSTKAGCFVDTQLACTSEECGLLYTQSSILCKLSLFGLNFSGDFLLMNIEECTCNFHFALRME